MKKLFLLFIISAITFISCSSEKEYPVKITEENGVKTISNPDYPKEGIYDLVLDELFTLGKDEDNSKYIFALPLYIELDSRMNLYVLDWDNFKFFVFNKQGSYLRQFGRKGQGPGDFELPADFKISSDDNIILNDARNTRICYLDSAGNYLSGFVYNKYHSKIEIDNKNNLYSDENENYTSKISSVMSPITSSKIILRYSNAENKWIQIGKFTGEIFLVQRMPNGGIMGGGNSNTFFWKLSKNNKIVTGFADVYEFSIHNPDGKLISKFGRLFKPYLNPNYVEGYKRPRYLPAFSRHNLFDDNNNFWVSVYSEPEKEIFIYDVFSEDGIFQKQVYSKYRITLIKGGKIYSIVRNDKDPIYIKAFKFSFKKREK